MTDIMFDYVLTLPEEIKQQVSMEMKDKRVIAVLADYGIEIPNEVLEAIDAEYANNDSHDSVMDSMRPYL